MWRVTGWWFRMIDSFIHSTKWKFTKMCDQNTNTPYLWRRNVCRTVHVTVFFFARDGSITFEHWWNYRRHSILRVSICVPLIITTNKGSGGAATYSRTVFILSINRYSIGQTWKFISFIIQQAQRETTAWQQSAPESSTTTSLRTTQQSNQINTNDG